MLLSGGEIERQGATLKSDWEIVDGKLRREFGFDNFEKAVEFVNMIAKVAEMIDHHPDVCVHDYKFVSVDISTHEAGGITQKDFDLALEIEGLG